MADHFRNVLSCDEVGHLLAHVHSRSSLAMGRAQRAAWLDRLTIESLLFSGLRTTEFCRLRVADTIVGCNESVFVVSGLAGRDRTVYVPTSVSRLVRRLESIKNLGV